MKAIKIFFAILILAVVGAAIAGVVVDNMTSANIESQIKSIDLPSNTSIDASTSRTGKLRDPNGPLEFYGAVLLQSNNDYGSLKAYYRDHSPEGLNLQVVKLVDSRKEFGDNFPADLRFSHHDAAPDHYYIVYDFGLGESPFPMMDYRSYFG